VDYAVKLFVPTKNEMLGLLVVQAVGMHSKR